MANVKVMNRWATLTPHRCGKCKDRLTEKELEWNRRDGQYGLELRCYTCWSKEIDKEIDKKIEEAQEREKLR